VLYVLQAAENSAVFTRDLILKEATEAADRTSDLREFPNEGSAVEKARHMLIFRFVVDLLCNLYKSTTNRSNGV